MDVVLIQPDFKELMDVTLCRSRIGFPQGLMHLAAVLCQEGYEVLIIDEVLEKDPYEKLLDALKTNPIAVGISSTTGSQINHGIKFAEIVRKNSKVPIVWGGAHPTILPEQTLKDDLVDIIVVGEGEYSFLELVKALENGDSIDGIKGICYKDGNGVHINPAPEEVDIDSIPELPYALVDMEAYITGIKKRNISRGFEILTSRGCPYSCYFCHNSIKKARWRYKNLGKLISEIEYLRKKYNIDGIAIQDENSFYSKKRIVEFSEELLRRNIKLTIRAGGARADQIASLDNSTLKLIKEAGFDHFAVGIESGSPRVLNIMNKRITLDQIYKTNQKMKEYGFAVTYNFMSGIPGEELEDYVETLKLILFLFQTNENLIAPVGPPKIFMPYPGTALTQKCIDNYSYKPIESFRDWGNYDYNTQNGPWLANSLKKCAIKGMEVVGNLNTRFTGEDANITEDDYRPLKNLIDMASSF